MRFTQTPDPQAPEVGTSGHSRIRILFVDDDVDFRCAMKVLLEREGYDVEVAADGSRADELRRARPFDVMITDLFMPQVDGFETVITARRESPSLKIVAMSSGGVLGNPDRYLPTAGVAGADAAIRKPFQIDALLDVLDKLTGSENAR